MQLDIYSEKQKENVILYIIDNGIGIKEGEINRIFEKGFTGSNGRICGGLQGSHRDLSGICGRGNLHGGGQQRGCEAYAAES